MAFNVQQKTKVPKYSHQNMQLQHHSCNKKYPTSHSLGKLLNVVHTRAVLSINSMYQLLNITSVHFYDCLTNLAHKKNKFNTWSIEIKSRLPGRIQFVHILPNGSFTTKFHFLNDLRHEVAL